MAERNATALWDNEIVKGALVDSMRKFDPRIQATTGKRREKKNAEKGGTQTN